MTGSWAGHLQSKSFFISICAHGKIWQHESYYLVIHWFIFLYSNSLTQRPIVQFRFAIERKINLQYYDFSFWCECENCFYTACYIHCYTDLHQVMYYTRQVSRGIKFVVTGRRNQCNETSSPQPHKKFSNLWNTYALWDTGVYYWHHRRILNSQRWQSNHGIHQLLSAFCKPSHHICVL